MSRHPVIVGLLGGALWGAVLRGWMRYISTSPEFTWSGTLFIVGAAALAGSVVGVLWWRHRVGATHWWKVLGIGVLPVFGGAGAVMLPSALLGAIGLGRTPWPFPVRATLVAIALGGQYVLLGVGGEPFPEGRVIPAIVWYTVMIGIQMWAISVLFRPHAAHERDAAVGRPIPSRAVL